MIHLYGVRGVISLSKTKIHNQTANTKCRKMDLYGEMDMRKFGRSFSQKREDPGWPDLLTPVSTLLNFWDKRNQQERSSRDGEKILKRYFKKINSCKNDYSMYNSAKNTEFLTRSIFSSSSNVGQLMTSDDALQSWLTPKWDCFWSFSRGQGDLQK